MKAKEVNSSPSFCANLFYPHYFSKGGLSRISKKGPAFAQAIEDSVRIANDSIQGVGSGCDDYYVSYVELIPVKRMNKKGVSDGMSSFVEIIRYVGNIPNVVSEVVMSSFKFRTESKTPNKLGRNMTIGVEKILGDKAKPKYVKAFTDQLAQALTDGIKTASDRIEAERVAAIRAAKK